MTRPRTGMTADQKAKALDLALGQIGKNFGEEAIRRLGDDSTSRVKSYPTGILPLDLALGIGGIPKGRIVEIYGPEAASKTTTTLHTIAQVQAAGGICAFIDAEHALDPVYASAIGVDLDNLLVAQPDNGEQALEIADTLVRSGAVDLIVVDSVSALTPRAEIEGEMGDSHVGLQARLMSQALRKMAGNADKNGCTVFFINQLREKIGVSFGSPETTSGGRALKFYASVRMDIRRIETLKNGQDFVGIRVRIKVVKNKVASPFRKAEFTVRFGKGADNTDAVIDLAVEHGIMRKAGAWYSYGNEQVGQGKDNSVDFLNANPGMLAEIELKVREACGLVSREDEVDAASDDTLEDAVA